MEEQAMFFFQRLAFALAATTLVFAQSPESVRKEIEASYAKSLEAFRNAKSMEDLDEINRTFDTADWQSITPGQPPTHWQDLRKYPYEEMWTPFQFTEFIVDTFDLKGDAAVLTGRLRTVNMKGNVGFIPLRETFKRTVAGWKRQIHQKFNPGETPK
jgi:hypothetical protein